MKFVHNYFRFALITSLTLISSLLAEVVISPSGVSVAMDEGEVQEVTVSVSNNGDSDVTFSVGMDRVDREDNFRQGPRRDEPNEVRILHFKGRGDNGFGWRDGNEHLAEWDGLDNEVDQANIEDFEDFST